MCVPQDLTLSSSILIHPLALIMILLVMLNLWSCLLSEYSFLPLRPGLLRFLLSRLSSVCVLFFLETRWIKFYIYFELSLVPIFLIIIGWGYQIERVKATKSIILYTISASLPLFFIILTFLLKGIDLISQRNLGGAISPIAVPLGLITLLAFIVKLPVFFVHLWLPKAHVEAPVSGSIFLAAVLLKLGGYGLVTLRIFIENAPRFKSGVARISAWSIVFVGVLCVQASDIKVLIAFSSVAHMALGLIVLCTSTSAAVACVVLVLLRHGLSSSTAFYFSYLFYKSSQTRRIVLNKCGHTKIGLIFLFWSICCLGVIGAPPTFNLWVEIISFISIISSGTAILKILFWRALLAGAYRISLLATPLAFNSQFLLTNKTLQSNVELVHLFHLIYLIIFLRFIIPSVLS